MVGVFRISATSDKFWNKNQFIDFLLKNRSGAIQLYMDPEAICLHTLGVYDLLDMFDMKHVDIFTYNPLETHSKFRIHLIENHWLDKTVKIDVGCHIWNQQKIFFSLFGRPTAARLVLGSYLLDRYDALSHLHFSINTDDDSLLHFELDKSLAYDKTSIQRIGRLIDRLPILMASSDRYTSTQGYDYQDPLTDFYKDILVDVVVESHVLGNSFFPTEKTLRPMYLKKPFLVFSNRDYFCYLRQMGFRTFYDYWDEHYDGFETTDRIKAMYRTIDFLAKLDIGTLNSMYIDMQPILDHNYHLLQEKNFSRKITKVV